ncbi:MAG: hypothetical protein B6I38_01025 [Anaerolineaceae bacterium 4572_5.1]|nr:MAG: hypothetical protein B5M51_09080 [Anaerolinea sp. 4484_236]OQY35876.1 MAG: hypothetical protein B6I38_01025 [Anaerolineaceae bacterium 4572_5.1]RLD09258.1 MAG: histidine kinase [Chloroflexota bacterium]
MLPDYRIRQRDYLLEIARALTQELNFDKLLARILRLATEMLAGKAGLIALRGERGGWNIAAFQGIPISFLEQISAILAEVPEHEEQAESELPEVSRLLLLLAKRSSLNLLTGVGLPLVSCNQVVGLIFVFRGYQGLFSNNDRALLRSFADQAAIAVRNAQLYAQTSYEKRRLDALLDSSADGMLILTADHTIERCNRAFARLYRQDTEIIQGQSHEDVIRWESRRQGTTLEEAEAGGWPLTPNANLYIEGDLQRPGGTPLPVGITYAPLLSSEGSLINIVASIRDITHFREAEELKSVFISVISHELKTPIALIKGYVGTLRRDDVSWDSEVVQDSLEVIEEETDRLTGLIEDMLDASRLQAGGLSFNSADINLVEITEDMVARFQTQTDKHKIMTRFPENFPVILGDKNRLQQVLSNLLSNAIKYSPAGGNIVVSGQIRAEQVIVCVQDEGPGIAPEDIPHIFDRFYRADDAVRETQGAGLGLYLTRAIIEAHAGRIWADPRPGGGARICFSLPIERD